MCRQQTTAITRCIAPLLYQPPVSQLIQQFKYGKNPLMAKVLTTIMLSRPDYRGINDCRTVIPVPTHTSRLRKRGFSPPLELAKKYFASSECQIRTDICERISQHKSQAGLNRKARLCNLDGDFRIIKTPPSRLILVDDVITTGATVETLARELQKAGCREIGVLAVAKTPRPV